ncbi:MAG: HU family DNA-binding protein [Candidatus Desulforudis sp.]|nr:HU family DNA-binding protein [Desulforudis sp.]
MNKAELVAAVAEKAGLGKKHSEAAVNAFTDAIAESLAKGDSVQLVGFGTFKIQSTAARKGRNPQTGEEIDIPASKKPVFKAGAGLKGAVEG